MESVFTGRKYQPTKNKGNTLLSTFSSVKLFANENTYLMCAFYTTAGCFCVFFVTKSIFFSLFR